MRIYNLVINPGSTSTKVALYKGKELFKEKKVEHKQEDIKDFETSFDQYDYRMDLILKWLEEEGVKTEELIAVVGRGGLLKAAPGGVYSVTDEMKKDLIEEKRGMHAANLGGLLAAGIAEKEGIPSYIVDAIGTDEYQDIARISGLKEIPRTVLQHTLNLKAVSRRRAEELGGRIEDYNFVVLHLGGGISVSALAKGQIIDSNCANEYGPFSVNRTGTLPVGELAKMCFSGEYTQKEMITKIMKTGGVISYLGINDMKEVTDKAENDQYAKLILDAMLYQIVKEAGSMATVLKGDVKNIIISGGMAYSDYIVNYIKDRISFIADIVVYPGEDEMDALNRGALRAEEGVEKVKIYEDEVKKYGEKF